jgi:hypothetical protein
MSQQLSKLCPNRDLQCYFFEPSAVAALSQTSASGFTVSGSWRQQFDWAVVEWNRDNVFEHPMLRNLPDGDLSGLQLTYDETRTNCILLDSNWYPTVDWPYLRIWADVGATETVYQVPLVNYATPSAGSYTPPTVSFQLQGTPTSGDYIELAWLDQHINYQLLGVDSLESALAALATNITAATAAGATATASGSQITLTYTGLPGTNGNRIGVYGTVHGAGTESWAPSSGLFSGGTSPTQWQVTLNFNSLKDIHGTPVPTSNVRKLRWTWAADVQAGSFVRSEFAVVVSNWAVTGTNLQYTVAGPGSRRIEDDNPSISLTPSANWTQTRGNYSGGSIQCTAKSGAQVSCTYTAQTAHSLYLGTRYIAAGALITASVDGATPQSINLELSGEDVLVRILLGQFQPGAHSVTLTNTSPDGPNFYFDFLEIAVPTVNLPSFATDQKTTLATDWDTEHSLALAPERTAWLIQTLGFQGRANHYAGALWFYELYQPGMVYASVTVQFTGAPVWSTITEIVLSGTSISHVNLIGDTAGSIASCFALLINAGSTGVWAQANGATLTITARAMGSQGNTITIVVNTNSTEFTASTSSSTLAGGTDGAPEGPAGTLWRTDLTVVPRLNRAARDWTQSFLGALKSYGIDVAVSFSMELGNGDDSVAADIAQRYPNGDPTWVSTPALQTNFGTESTAFWQQVYLDMANVMAAAGLVPYLQFGEVQWWYFAAASGMPFYDDYTENAFQAAYGRAMQVIPSQNSAPADFPNECAFLPTLIGQFTDTIMAFVRQTYPDARFEVLYPPDTNDTPLNQLINLPLNSWTPAKLNCFKTENFTFTGNRDLDQALASIELPITMGFPRSQSSHLVGIGEYTTPWEKEWDMSYGQGIESVVLFALDQFCLIGYNPNLTIRGGRSLYMGR